MPKNWTGNKKSIFVTLGASNHTAEKREENDYYATEPKATELLLELEKFDKNILEPSCGEGHISKVLEQNNYSVTSSDLINRGFGKVKNFYDYKTWNGDIITNPPYKYATIFVEHSLKIIPLGNKIAMFLKVQFMESLERAKLFVTAPPSVVYISSRRLACAKNGDFHLYSNRAVAYAWYIWQKGYTGNTVLKWFNYNKQSNTQQNKIF